MQLVGFTASFLADCSLSPVTVDVVVAYRPSHGMAYTAYSCLQRPSLWQILPALCLLLSLVPMSDVTGEGTKGGHEPVHAFPVDV